jgi:RecB family exonuclease
MIPLSTDSLYITSTARLARSLRHRFRNARIDEGYRGWETLQSTDLNAWLSRAWAESWPEEMPAPDILRIHLWKELTDSVPPPAPLDKDLGLYRLLDENYGIMKRHRIDPLNGPPSTPLVEWRRQICRSFETALHDRNLFHPSELPDMVCRKIAEKAITCPGSVSLIGFESPAPVEMDLFSLLEKKCDVRHIKDSRNRAKHIEAVALPSPEQEVIYLVHRLIEDAGVLPLHRIGVVVPDLHSYAERIERCLNDVMGENLPTNAQWFNITLGRPVSELPLIKAALIPLRFFLADESRELFLTLILSPYYGYWKQCRQETARADLTWRELSVRSGLENLLLSLGKNDPALREKILAGNPRDIMPFLHLRPYEKKKGSFWIKSLEEMWSRLQFPVVSDERDNIALRHLREIMDDLRKYLSEVNMDGGEFLSWIINIAANKKTQTGASEYAGIQIMGIIESRGLDFDKAYVLDMNDRSLPRPVRPLPLLDASERGSVQGGNPESQYEFAEKAFQNIMCLSQDITLMRAEQEDSEPLSPSPFWPAGALQESINIWNEQRPTWLRANWLRSAHAGSRNVPVNRNDNDSSMKDSLLNPEKIPEVLSTGRIETAITCPFMFFADTILKIKPLEEIEPGISPLERGKRLHRVLASFTQKIRETNCDLEKDRERAFGLLCDSADEVLRHVIADPLWKVERRRWLGEHGLLISWLDEELKHWHDGWRCIAEEIDFKDLTNETWPFSLRGRIDRIDYRESGDIICWDYKTGNMPASAEILSRFTASQLPVYLLALRENRVEEIKEYSVADRTFKAGYIQLKSPKDIKISSIDGIESSLDEWKEVISRIGKILKSGDMTAHPYPVSDIKRKYAVCEKCRFLTICLRGLQPGTSTMDEEKDEE